MKFFAVTIAALAGIAFALPAESSHDECQPGTYRCDDHTASGQPGWDVCNTSKEWVVSTSSNCHRDHIGGKKDADQADSSVDTALLTPVATSTTRTAAPTASKGLVTGFLASSPTGRMSRLFLSWCVGRGRIHFFGQKSKTS
ncbi:hypothetical protein E4U41_004186 [Claviceps citrina]|nr:hypothetical protein E4U41_004186 [Claviceps citrina]